MQKVKVAYGLNLLLFAMVVIATCWMMSGVNGGALSNSGVGMLRYFTVDSNILIGIFAFVAAIDQRRVLRGEKSEISLLTYVLKLMGTVSVALTMLVTIFFLTPTMYLVYGLFGLFAYSNFLLHLANPLVAIVTFVVFEKTDRLRLKHVFAGIVPMVAYAVYYVGTCVVHSTGGIIHEGYDWYGFFFAGLQSGFIVLPIIVPFTLCISFALWGLNRRKSL